MNTRPRAFFLALLLFFGGTSIESALATASSKDVTHPAPLTQTYTWNDGQQEHTVWVNPSLLAEFDPVAENRSPLKQALPSAQVLPSKGAGLRLWKLDSGVTSEGLARTLKTNHPQGKYSPILHDSASASGRMRALPGNVIVYLNPSWTNDQITAWAQSRRLEIVKKLAMGPNIYLLKSDPGLAALELANALHQSGDVVAAFPDWWQETVAR